MTTEIRHLIISEEESADIEKAGQVLSAMAHFAEALGADAEEIMRLSRVLYDVTSFRNGQMFTVNARSKT